MGLGKYADMLTVANAMQWAVRTVVQRSDTIRLVINKDDKGITDSILKLLASYQLLWVYCIS